MVIQNQQPQITIIRGLEQDQNPGTLQEHRIKVSILESDLRATLQMKEVVPPPLPLKQVFLLF